MTLAPGFRVGPYEIRGPLGEGGMGTVYRARDPRLDRDVALKVLRAEVMADHDRQARFLLEAKAVSALNHPNIVTVHDVGTQGDIAYMVMELVEGKSLDQLIPSHGLRASEVLKIGAQIADAFARAHAAQIVHRDLKPANVMVQPDGRVKVLDFGLAKLVERSGEAAAKQSMVTQTAEGTIMGTAAYMSPEQAEGKPLDARSDIFSFGALLYEMCTGKRAFKGDSSASVLAEVLRQDPSSMTTLRPDVPPELARLITRCLRKDPTKRVQSMADLKVALEELNEDVESGKLSAPVPLTASVPVLRRWWIAAAAGAIIAAVAGVALWNQRRVPAAPEVPSQPVPLTSFAGREVYPSFSPDGNQIAFNWDGEREDNPDIYVKLVGAGPPLRLTTDPRPDIRPKWSPDGRHVAFLRALDNETVSVLLVPPLGGPERRLAQFYTRVVLGMGLASVAWTNDSRFLFVTGARTRGEPNQINRVSVETGEIVTMLTAEGNSNGYMGLAVAPDGRTLAAILVDASGSRPTKLIALSDTWDVQGVRSLTSIASGVDSQAWTSDSKELVFRFAVNLPVPLYRVSVDGGQPMAMGWVGPDAFAPAISRDGRRLAFVRNFRDTNIWRVNLDGPASSSPAIDRLAASSFREVYPQFSPDGKRLVFYSNRSGSVQIWTSDADGSRVVQLTNMDPLATTGSPRWSPDGERVVFDSNAGGGYHVYEISADGGQAKAMTSGSSSNFIGCYSPDGRWIYFSSDRSGRLEVWRMPSQGGTPEQVTRETGQAPTVSADNAWVYYTKKDGVGGLWRMPINGGAESQVLDVVFRYNYALTSSGLYYVSPLNPDGSSSVKYLDFKTGSQREIVALDKPADLGLAVSPDGRFLLFTKLDYSGTDLMLVENFR